MNPILDVLWSQLHHAAGLKGRDRNPMFPSLFLDVCRHLSPQLSVEIGAHDAEFSRRINQENPAIKTYAFEANPNVFSKFAPGMPPGVCYINKAVAADAASRRFHIPRLIPSAKGERRLSVGNAVGSLLRRSAEDVRYDEVSCACTTLDAVHQQSDWPASVLWIDVEGAVGEVLMGGFRAVARSVRAAMIEVETVPAWRGQWLAADVIHLMESLGFCPAVRDLEGPWQYNWIFIRRECLDEPIAALIRRYADDLLSRAAPDQPRPLTDD